MSFWRDFRPSKSYLMHLEDLLWPQTSVPIYLENILANSHARSMFYKKIVYRKITADIRAWPTEPSHFFTGRIFSKMQRMERMFHRLCSSIDFKFARSIGSVAKCHVTVCWPLLQECIWHSLPHLLPQSISWSITSLTSHTRSPSISLQSWERCRDS